MCKKKLSWVQQMVPCKCKQHLCGSCMSSHQCEFDYASENKKNLQVAIGSPTVFEKMEKI